MEEAATLYLFWFAQGSQSIGSPLTDAVECFHHTSHDAYRKPITPAAKIKVVSSLLSRLPAGWRFLVFIAYIIMYIMYRWM